jgi:hypothetical protein
VKGRCIDHRQHLRTGLFGQAGGFFKPGVFANQQAHANARARFTLENTDTLPGVK